MHVRSASILLARVATILLIGSTSALVVSPSRALAADDATAQARSHYEMGLKLFDAREHEQALIEFQAANSLKPRPAALFMMAQCEYLLGRLKDARANYERYASENPTGEFVELAKDRIQSIDKRLSTLAINTVPEDVVVRIRPDGPVGEDAPAAAIDLTGQAPNNFQVPRGRYRIDVTKKNYQGQTRIVDVDLAETKPLFFKLDPIPARLEIETSPPGATLYVNGNRARNPYRQDVTPGHYEIFAEAADHEGRAIEFALAPGERKLLLGRERLHLSYEQRSGRPELIVASTLIGGFVGAGAVAAAIGSDLESPNVSTVFLITGGGVAGMITGALIATPVVPRYISDNRALFVIGSMWIGAAEGVGAGIVWQQLKSRDCVQTAGDPYPHPCRPPLGLALRAGFVGSLPGLAMGLTAGALLADHSPTYGRVAVIQSAALGGIFAGALVQISAQWKPYGASYYRRPPSISEPEGATTAATLDLTPGALIGLNVGLVAGILGTYGSDLSKYGPSWKRVLLVDLAAGAGMLIGGISGCVAQTNACLTSEPNDDARSISAAAGLAGGAIGLAGGVLLTRHMDDDPQQTNAGGPTVTLVPTAMGDRSVMPGLAAVGSF